MQEWANVLVSLFFPFPQNLYRGEVVRVCIKNATHQARLRLMPRLVSILVSNTLRKIINV